MFPDADRSHRLEILTASEIEDWYGLPRFTSDDRRLYFDLTAVEHRAAAACKPVVAPYFVLQLGYFKAKQQFFSFQQEATVLEDLHHIVERHFPSRDLASVRMPGRVTRMGQQNVILRLMRYRFCDETVLGQLERKAQRSARLSIQPIFLLREILQGLAQERIVAPAYKTLQDLVGRVVRGERDRISLLLEQDLSRDNRQRLDSLFEADEYLSRVSALRKEPKDFSYQEMRREVQRRQMFAPLHEFAKTFLVKADISMDSRRYYASLVQFYTIYKLKRMEAGPAHLYLLCFASYRFRQVNDHLIEAFIHLVYPYEHEARAASQSAGQQRFNEVAVNLQAAGHVLTCSSTNRSQRKHRLARCRRKLSRYSNRRAFPPFRTTCATSSSIKPASNGRTTESYRRSSNATCGTGSPSWNSRAGLRITPCCRQPRFCKHCYGRVSRHGKPNPLTSRSHSSRKA